MSTQLPGISPHWQPAISMDKTRSSTIRSVLILKADRLCAETLQRLTREVLPHALIRIAPNITRASLMLRDEPVDLLITGVGASLGGDICGLLCPWLEASQIHHVFVVTTNREHRQLALLRKLAIRGAFDSASETSAQFKTALTEISNGRHYWSRSFLDLLSRYSLETNSPSHLLTDSEQLMLSVIGDGSDDNEAALKLGLSPATVSTVRRNLHHKLGLRHRGELVRLAAQTGYVRFTPGGITRPGFALLTAACRRHRRDGTHAVSAAA